MRVPLRALCLGVFAAAPVAAQEWPAPDGEKTRANPYTTSPELVKRGDELFQALCAMCHGPRGKGDGPLAGLHATRTAERPRDLSDPALQKRLTDGEIHWKIGNGLKRGEQVIMPGFEKAASASDRWKIVLFVRSLGPAPK